MCSINGVLAINGSIDSTNFDRIDSIINKGVKRGKDACGIAFIGDKTIFDKRFGPKLSKYSDTYPPSFLVMSNNRAEPTTEFINTKTIEDIQPYISSNCIAVHNGTIANDKELVKKYNLPVQTSIDSAVIPWLFDNIGKTEYQRAVEVLQNELIGSYAVAIYNYKTETLYLATNYKPLSIMYTENYLYFSSLEEFMVASDYNRIFEEEKIIEVKPYTLLVIHRGENNIHSFDLYKETPKRKKALILASAGLDSTVSCAWAIAQGYETSLLHFDYKCRADQKENKCIRDISDFYNIPIQFIELPFFEQVIGGSNLYGKNSKIETSNSGADGAELAIEWVPARNLVFFSIAAAYAEARGIDYIILGGNLEESGAYADNELIFQQKFNNILPYSLNLQHRVQVLTPVADLMKRDIVKLGLELNAPLHLTWSCYENGDIHCGTCGPCYMRKTAFKMLNEPEVIKYKTDE